MTARRRPGLAFRLAVAVAVVLAVVAFERVPAVSGWLERQEAFSLDWRLRMRGPEPAPADLRIVQFHDATIDAAGGWPIDRALWARLVETLAAAGARTVVLDALFEPRADDGDARLATAIRDHGGVVLAVAVVRKAGGGVDLLGPAEVLATAAAGSGHTALGLGVEGRLMALPAFVPVGERLVPALALDALRVHRRLPPRALVPDEALGAVLDRAAVAPASRRQFLLRPYGPAGTIPTLAAADLLDGATVDLRDTLVVVGADAVAVGERFRTAFDVSLSGAEALATAVGNLLEARTLVPERAGGILATAFAAWLGVLLLGRFHALVSAAVAVALAASLLATAQVLLVAHDRWLPLAAPLLALLLAAIAIEGARLLDVQRAERELAFQRRNLGRFFAPAVAERIARTGRVEELDRSVEATVMFVDLVGFTPFSERSEPAAAMAELRRTLAGVEAKVFAEGGTLVTFLGDGCLACFGVPEPAADAPARALACARAIVRDHQGALAVSIGLHHGPLTMGNGGGARQFQFTVIGDTVNVASRIEGLSRDLGASIVVSTTVLDRARSLQPHLVVGFQPAPPLTLRGRSSPIDVAYLPRER